MPRPDRIRRPGSLEGVSPAKTSPTVVEVLRLEDLPLGSRGSRRAVVRWGDGTEDEALLARELRAVSASTLAPPRAVASAIGPPPGPHHPPSMPSRWPRPMASRPAGRRWCDP